MMRILIKLISAAMRIGERITILVLSGPQITIDWKADGGQQLTVPRWGIGKIVRFGKLPVNFSMAAYYNVVKPENAANWQLRAQLQFMFPK